MRQTHINKIQEAVQNLCIDANYNLSKENDVFVNCLTEFQVGYVSKNIISLAVEYSQLSGFSDISYIKAYNYDFNLRKELSLKDLFNLREFKGGEKTAQGILELIEGRELDKKSEIPLKLIERESVENLMT